MVDDMSGRMELVVLFFFLNNLAFLVLDLFRFDVNEVIDMEKQPGEVGADGRMAHASSGPDPR